MSRLGLVALMLGLAVGSAARVAAQDVPVVFIHGIHSSADTWRGAAQRLSGSLQIAPHLANLPSTAVLQTQTSALNHAFGGLPANTLAVGHSQGGLIAREWSRTKPLSGILTLGTPHNGSQLAWRGAELVNFNYLIYNVAGLAAGTTAGDFNWLYTVLQVYFSNTQSLAASVVTSLTSSAAIATLTPVAAQLVPGSSFLNNLNAAGNLGREHQTVPRRVALSYIAHNYWLAGMAVGLAPSHQAWAAAVMLVSPPAFEAAAAWLDTNYPPWQHPTARFLALRLRDLAGLVRDMDPRWCWAVTGDRTCSIPHDGIVSVVDQRYPGPGAVNFGVMGPAHAQQTQQSDGVIASVLTGLMGVRTRGSGPAPPAPPPAPPPGGNGPRTMTPGQRLYAHEYVTSPDGRMTLLYQGDGNLVLYASHHDPLWDTATHGSSPGHAEMQTDGNLVVYDGAGTPIWATDTYAPGAHLEVHDNGSLIIRDPSGVAVWWSGSSTH